MQRSNFFNNKLLASNQYKTVEAMSLHNNEQTACVYKYKQYKTCITERKCSKWQIKNIKMDY